MTNFNILKTKKRVFSTPLNTRFFIKTFTSLPQLHRRHHATRQAQQQYHVARINQE
jgi:hypothetical protein